MKISGKISNLLRSITLIVGLLSISISVFEYRIQDRIQDEMETASEESGKDAGDQNYLPDYQATISSFQLHLENTPGLPVISPVLIMVRDWVQMHNPITELNYFRTLFQHIIAPNAP